jgi:F420-0:gamma-glutamyl ligase-like protein
VSIKANNGKNLKIECDGVKYLRLPLKTHVIEANENIIEVVAKYAKEHLQKKDIVFISEKIVAISQGRAFHIDSIKPSILAKFLARFVHKSPYGIGLGSPWTMELAIREIGAFKIFIGAIAAAFTKPFGIKGVFYKIVGNNINAIDGPCDYTIPPYNKYAKLAPKDPEKVAKSIAKKISCKTVIIDANDLGVTVLGKSSEEITDDFCKKVFRDNPLGQTNEQTPICLVRKI